MTTLHLGVIDIPYAEPPPAPKRAPKKPRRGRKARSRKYSNITTGDVAEILEAKYHVMEHFFELHENEVLSVLEESLEGSLESLLMGAPASINPFGTGTAKIEDAFKKMLDTKELDGLGYPGIPTQAALMGVSHRFKQPYRRRPPRPSFIDTGEYQASFKAWVD
jgi:hypothetical protein